VQFFSNVRAIIDDIKHSWYFRIYAFFWLFFALFTFSVLIILGQQSTRAQKEPVFLFWRENATSINFPRFRFRLNNHADTFNQTVVCYFERKPLATVPCASRSGTTPEPMTKCQAVASDGVVAENQVRGHFLEKVIMCGFTTTYQPDATENLLVSFELEGEHIANFGANAYSSMFVAPNNNTWILLEKSYITFEGKPEREEWEREIVYHTTVSQPGQYRIFISINRFWVIHGEQTNDYDGWMALGEIGGFGYFLFLMHALVMILAGICLNNDAKTLKGGNDGYVSVEGSKEERANML